MGQTAQAIGWPDLAGVVAKALTARGYTTLHARAEVTGIKPSTLNRRLKYQKPFTAPELAKIAEVLGMSLSELARAAEDAA